MEQRSPNIDPSKAHTLPASIQLAQNLKVSEKKPIMDPMTPSSANMREIQKTILGPPNNKMILEIRVSDAQ